MNYGLTQDFIKRTRERFKSGELTYEEAMWYLEFEYEENKQLHDDFGYEYDETQYYAN